MSFQDKADLVALGTVLILLLLALLSKRGKKQ